MGKRILMILGHDFLEPFVDPRVYKEAKTLLGMGHQVTLFCFSWESEVLDYEGIKVVKIKHFFNAKKMLKSRSFLALLMLCIDLPVVFVKTFIKAIFISSDFIHCHDVDTLPLGVLIRLVKWKNKLIYDSHELSIGMPFPRYIILLIKIVERLSFPFVYILITANESRLNIMRKTYPFLLKNKKCLVIHNYPSPVSFDEIVPATIHSKTVEGKIVFIYQGPLDKNRGIIEILNTFVRLESDRWFLLIVGGTLSQVESLKKEFNHSNIFFTGFIGNNEVYRYMKIADVGILALKNTCLNNYYTAPNKLYEYMQCRCAVLGPDFDEMKEFINKNDIGFLTDFDDAIAIKTTIEFILSLDKNKIELIKDCAFRVSSQRLWVKNENILKSIYAD